MNTQSKNKHVYFLNEKMYINLTNLCSSSCVFCIRELNDSVEGIDLRLKNENLSSAEIIEEIKNSPKISDEIVFCGYGEPLIKLEAVKEVAYFIKKEMAGVKIRINTNGHANLIHKRNVVPELKGLIDSVSVSLNSDNPAQYKELTRCSFEATECFEGVKNFIKECVRNDIDTTASVVTGFKDYKIDVEKCSSIANELGAKFRIREWLDEGYK